MGKPTGTVALFTIIYVIGIILSFRLRKESGVKLFFWCLISLIIYQAGNFHFFEEVKKASHHGNTIHGWYAEGNASEKISALLWIIGFPIGSNVILIYLLYKFKK